MRILILGIALFLASPATANEAPVIALIGDSTVENYTGSIEDRQGWGAKLSTYLTDGATVKNFAIGGRSSKSFLLRDNWQPVLDVGPDYVLIQFGHNDRPDKPDSLRTLPGIPPETFPDEPGLGYRAEDWYRLNLTKYVNEARGVGAVPVLVTPMERRIFKDGDFVATFGDYVDAVEAVASELNVSLIDLNTFSIELYSSLGQEATDKYHALTDGPDGEKIIDWSHFSELGADLYAAEVAKSLQAREPGLSSYIVPEPSSALLLIGSSLVFLRHR